MSWRRVVYGDWSWFIRDPLDVLRLAFVCGTIAFALIGRSTAVGLTAASVLLLVARIVDLPRRFDLGVIVAMTLIAWGTALGLYGDYYVYDNIVHSVSPFFYAPVLYVVLVRLDVLADPEKTSAGHHHVGVFISTLALGMAVGAGYEVIEWLSDSLVGTHFVKSIDDTGSDLLEDTLGSLAGAGLVAVWSIRHWSTRRATVVVNEKAGDGVIRRIASAARQRLRVRAGSGILAWRTRAPALPLALSGTIGVVAGAVTFAWPSPALRTVEVVFGLAMLAQAALDLPEGIRRRGIRRGGRLAAVVAEATIGTVVIAWPGISRPTLLYAVGASAVILALLEVASLSAGGGRERDRWLAGVGSVLAFVFGVAILALPDHSLDATVVVFALYLLSLGGFRLVRALEARRAASRSPVERGYGDVDDHGEVVGAATRAEPPGDDR